MWFFGSNPRAIRARNTTMTTYCNTGTYTRVFIRLVSLYLIDLNVARCKLRSKWSTFQIRFVRRGFDLVLEDSLSPFHQSSRFETRWVSSQGCPLTDDAPTTTGYTQLRICAYCKRMSYQGRNLCRDWGSCRWFRVNPPKTADPSSLDRPAL